MKCPCCENTLQWDDGAFCKSCMEMAGSGFGQNRNGRSSLYDKITLFNEHMDSDESEKPPGSEVSHLFHELWGQCKLSPEYDKSKWLRLQELLRV